MLTPGNQTVGEYLAISTLLERCPRDKAEAVRNALENLPVARLVATVAADIFFPMGMVAAAADASSATPVTAPATPKRSRKTTSKKKPESPPSSAPAAKAANPPASTKINPAPQPPVARSTDRKIRPLTPGSKRSQLYDFIRQAGSVTLPVIDAFAKERNIGAPRVAVFQMIESGHMIKNADGTISAVPVS